MNSSYCILSFAALVAVSSAFAEEKLPKGVTLITPDKIQWVKTPSGRELAYLHGHPDKPGPYLYLVKWPPNNKAIAHKHPDDRYGIVLSGTHYIGYGDRSTRNNCTPIRPGPTSPSPPTRPTSG